VQRTALARILLPLCIEGFCASFEDRERCCLQDAAEVAVVAGDVVQISLNEVEASKSAIVEERPQLGGCGSDGVEFIGEGLSWSAFFGAFPAGHDCCTTKMT